MAARPVKLIVSLALLIVLAAISSCYIPVITPWQLVRKPEPMKVEMGVLGPIHPWVPETVLYINGQCQLVDEGGSVVTDLEVIRGSKVTIWNQSDVIAYVDFGSAFSPPGDVRLNPEWGVWRRVSSTASTSGFEVWVTCEALGDGGFTTYALPDTIVTPPPGGGGG